jgi:hypothetical protein
MAKPDLIPGGGARESDALPQLPMDARWATEEEVSALPSETYFDNVAFDVGQGESRNLIFPDAQSREDFVAELNDRQPRDMEIHSNW